MTTTEFTRVEPGHYEGGGYAIKREATTGGIHRASNPMWRIYDLSADHGRYLRQYATLAEAQQCIRRGTV